ncbi:hypothetical protein [Escherichia phage AV124]|nr:hypothetical protein [Escherichia phage AV124]
MSVLQEFTPEEVEKLRNRLKHKKLNARKRGLDCDLTMQDMRMLGFKLLGHGSCDYTGLPFSTNIANDGEEANPRYPSIERIDDSKGYVRGNVCVVMLRANQLKDRLVDKTTSILIQDPLDREIVKAMMLNMSKDHLEKLKTKYIPQQENEMNTEETMQNAMDNAEEHVHNQKPAAEETSAQKEAQKLPEDVSVALAYARYCNTFHEAGMSVSVTYSQFKARYIRNTCALSGEKLTEEPKSILILDLNIGFAKDNFIIVSKKMETAMTQLMIQTGLSLPKVAAMLNKVV